jgi:hypothetical protein
VILSAKGPSVPVGLPAALQATAALTLQLRSSDGICLSIDLTDIGKQEAAFFKAR